MPSKAACWVLVAAGAGPALAAEGASAGQALIQPHIGTIFWTLVTFILLAFVLGRFAWKPLLGALDQRERSIEDRIDQAAKDRDEARSLLEQHKALLEQARRERAEAVAAGQRDAEKVREAMLDEARRQRDQLLAQTQEQLAAGLKQARSELRATAADLAIRAAERLLSKNLDDATQRSLVEEYLDDLERADGSTTLPS